MFLYRIALCKFVKDLSGYGAEKFGGRWNSKGVPAIYFSSSLSLSTLELLVNSTENTPLKNICYIKIEIPDNYKLKIFEKKELPETWNQYPYSIETAEAGTKILNDNKYGGLKIPSAVLPIESYPEEYNIILNPLFEEFKYVKIHTSDKYNPDKRLI